MRKLVLLSLAVLLLLAIGAAAWLFYSPSGARFLLHAIPRIAPVRVSVGETTGSLADRLIVRNFKVELREMPFVISGSVLEITWHPERLLYGTAAIDRLYLKDVLVADNRPKTETPFTFSWPRLSRGPAGLHGWVRDFRADRVQYRRLGETVLAPVNIGGRIWWHNGILSVTNLDIGAAGFNGKGTVEAGFLKPALRIDGSVDFDPHIRSLTRLTVKADLGPGRVPVELTGPLSAKGLLAEGEGAALDSSITLAKELIGLDTFRLAYSAVAGEASGKGSLFFGAKEPYLQLDSRLKDIGPKHKDGLRATSDLRLVARRTGYNGDFSITGGIASAKKARWQTGQAKGTLQGDWERCLFAITEGKWLGGLVAGDVKIEWAKATTVTAALRGRGFDPSYLSTDWTGRVNTNADLRIETLPGSTYKATIRASFPESILRGQRLVGELAASYQPDLFRVDRLLLRGNGFDVRGSGVLDEKMRFDVAVADMSGLVPGFSGSVAGDGWFRWKNGRLAGDASGKSNNLAIETFRVGKSQFSATMDDNADQRVTLRVNAHDIVYNAFAVDRILLSAQGTRANHLVDATLHAGRTDVHLTANGAQSERTWKGTVTGLTGRDELGTWGLEQPSSLLVSTDRLQVGAMRFASSKRESLEVQGLIFFSPLKGNLRTAWESIDLARLYQVPALNKTNAQGNRNVSKTVQERRQYGRFPLTGTTDGNLAVDWPNGAGRSIVGQAKVAGRYHDRAMALPLTGQTQVRWNDTGLVADWGLAQGAGKVSGRISAKGPPVFELPERATAKAEWRGVDLALFQPWLPENLALKGQLAGDVEGEVLPGGSLNLAGKTTIDKGSAGWQTNKGLVTTSIQDGTARFTWFGASMKGQLSLALAEYGKIDGVFSLPLPARLPAAFVPDGPLALTLKGKINEKGLITALIPTAVQETKGTVDLDVVAAGTWRDPRLSGGMTLQEASAYIPAAGVRIEHVQGQATFAGEDLKVRLRGESGGGWLEASGNLRVGRAEGLSYEGSVTGNACQVLRVPEVRAFVTPRLTIQGNAKTLTARGEVNVPRMSIYGTRGESAVRASPDIVVVDAPQAKKSQSSIALDVQVRVTLGDNVRIEAQGVDARLAGSLDVTMAGVDDITARGRVRMVDGGYKAYGVRLSIERGNINFFGPIDRPTLDVLAVRKVQDVTAGVQVSGSARSPVITLYSSPQMSDSDKLSYIILGQRLNTADTAGANTIAGAAGIFEGGATPTMTSEARKRLGLQGPPGSTAQEQAAQSMISVGRYLTPAFYVGIGRSLTTGENLVTLRYNLSKNWEAESRLGRETGLDVFYKIEFD